jgi:acetyl-CoA carboxylase biotin carboxyl carrier protein
MSDPKAPNGDSGKDGPIDTRLVRKLADILNATDLTEIEVERGDLKVRVARQAVVAHAAPMIAAQPAAAPVQAAPAPLAAPAAAAPPAVTSQDLLRGMPAASPDAPTPIAPPGPGAPKSAP